MIFLLASLGWLRWFISISFLKHIWSWPIRIHGMTSGLYFLLNESSHLSALALFNQHFIPTSFISPILSIVCESFLKRLSLSVITNSSFWFQWFLYFHFIMLWTLMRSGISRGLRTRFRFRSNSKLKILVKERRNFNILDIFDFRNFLFWLY